MILLVVYSFMQCCLTGAQLHLPWLLILICFWKVLSIPLPPWCKLLQGTHETAALGFSWAPALLHSNYIGYFPTTSPGILESGRLHEKSRS